ncbi:esterase FE4-like [Pieris rapae]|uniref:esterase FE4-like n=1 Tax=Pieris rapae TaxID=64459 RepID=UPI001E27DF07|nr:esterase FE4-like [Pieris rapae]
MWKWLVFIWLIATKLLKDPGPVIKVKDGLLRGRTSVDGNSYQYFGIPYGTVDQTNRFQAPLPPIKWKGIFEAINENTRCPQKMFGPIIAGVEDCLKLNIYTPITTVSHLRAVMVYIHGGCFFEGIGNAFLYGPDYFVDNDVIFVGINYRLNVEGFLCLGIKEAPGNAGLKDQIAALRWVKENIAAFGGNPNNITIFGESAGAVSVSHHIMSPASRGLFSRAILQSGSALAPWGLQHDPLETARNLAKEFGYYGKDPLEIYKTLSNRSIEELINAIKFKENKNYITAEILFAPCVENVIPGIEPVITKHPVDTIISGNYTKVPMIIGYNDQEGIYFVAKDFGTSLKQKPNDILHGDLEFPSELSKNASMQEINKYYFSSGKEDFIMDMINLYSDLHFKYPAVIESELYARTSDQPIYYYLFKYSGYINMPKIISYFGFVQGASHADELFYLFKPHTFPLPTRILETHMIKRMVTLWTNFAKYGEPTPTTSPLLPVKWQPSQAWNPKALVIDRHLTTSPLWDEGSISLWNKTYIKYRRKRYGFR